MRDEQKTNIRKLETDDAVLWRSIRLDALLQEPDQFSAHHADWVDRPLADFADQLAKSLVWAVIEAGSALAVASLTSDLDDTEQGWVEAVYVRPKARGKGLARALLTTVETAARSRGLGQLRLEVRSSNARARQLYGGMGFVEVDAIARSCGNRCEITMVKTL